MRWNANESDTDFEGALDSASPPLFESNTRALEFLVSRAES